MTDEETAAAALRTFIQTFYSGRPDLIHESTMLRCVDILCEARDAAISRARGREAALAEARESLKGLHMYVESRADFTDLKVFQGTVLSCLRDVIESHSDCGTALLAVVETARAYIDSAGQHDADCDADGECKACVGRRAALCAALLDLDSK